MEPSKNNSSNRPALNSENKDETKADPVKPDQPPEAPPGGTDGPTLKGKLNDIRWLWREKEVKKREIGVLVALIQDLQLAEKEGYRSTLDCLQKEFGEVTGSTLYSYAAVARQFTTLNVAHYGIKRLQALSSYQHRVDGKPSLLDPGDYILQVQQPDGSFPAKEFRDCALSEIPRNPKLIGRQGKKKAIGKAPKKVQSAQPRPTSLRLAILMVLVGWTATWAAGFVPAESSLGAWMRWSGIGLFGAGVFKVIGYFKANSERWFSAVMEGSGLSLLIQSVQKLSGVPKADPAAEPPAAPQKRAGTEVPTSEPE